MAGRVRYVKMSLGHARLDSDMLGGHLDDMEVDWSKPIVSMSLGCKAIFLLGGKSRTDEPLAMFLCSGNIVLLSGEAMKRFHGQYSQDFQSTLLLLNQ
ncbi:alpha-ketoglutarate-dependent dioxygenase AlkB [Tanacetum coccineum]